jgi:hypothetical protein
MDERALKTWRDLSVLNIYNLDVKNPILIDKSLKCGIKQYEDEDGDIHIYFG